jgi:hypothetical protein
MKIKINATFSLISLLQASRNNVTSHPQKTIYGTKNKTRASIGANLVDFYSRSGGGCCISYCERSHLLSFFMVECGFCGNFRNAFSIYFFTQTYFSRK